MELTSLFSGSDNLFKYLFTLGAFMVLISIFYPLQKQYDLEVEINGHNKEVELINARIAELKSKTYALKRNADKITVKIDSLKSAGKKIASKSTGDIIKSEISRLAKSFNVMLDSVKSERSEIRVSEVVLKYDQRRIELLQKQADGFNRYYWWGLIIGILFLLSGLMLWAVSTWHTETLKKMEIDKLKKELASSRFDEQNT